MATGSDAPAADEQPEDSRVVSVRRVIDALPGPWQPRDLVVANDTVVRIARFDGAFEWHTHDEDEVFLCWDGSIRIDLEAEASVVLHAGELFVVPRGRRHRPFADGPAHALMIERPETRQYGNR